MSWSCKQLLVVLEDRHGLECLLADTLGTCPTQTAGTDGLADHDESRGPVGGVDAEENDDGYRDGEDNGDGRRVFGGLGGLL